MNQGCNKNDDVSSGRIGAVAVSCLGILAMIFVITVVWAIPVYFLWNWLMPTIFGLPEITLIQSWGLNLLSAFLIKSHTTQSKG